MSKDIMPSISFEAGLTRLEEVVKMLEHGEIPLEQSIDLFEEGIKLANLCQHKIVSAKQRVEVLSKEHGEWIKKSFTASDADG